MHRRRRVAVLPLCALIMPPLAVAAVAADTPKAHNFTAASSARIEIMPDDVVVMQAHNARLVPYVLYDGDRHRARLATITTDVRTRTDAEGTDPASTVSFAIDDVSGAEPKRLSSFGDPGATGEIVGERYSVATMPGCCGGADIHRVRALETGRALFRAAGDGVMGSAAWAEAPNAKPRTVRWAAFDGDIGEKEAAAGVLGHIAYGSDEGVLSVVELRAKARDDDLALGLSHAAELVWIDPKASADNGPPSPGAADSPQSVWAIEGIAEPAGLGGFSLALTLENKRLLEIPIAADRLDASKAKSTAPIVVSAAPR
jgi:hypothetical protein